ncbi:MAG: FG-GAP repeat protein [Ignavibacteriae bacterium]|nr:FG-GAP repeat protein [Ignavibacteriota bacterium]
MKNLFTLLSFLVCTGLIFTGFTVETSDDYKFKFSADSPLNLSKLNHKSEGKEESENPESSDWYKEALSNIQKAEYNVSFSEDLNTYQSPNRANNMRFVYHKNGFSAKLRDNKVALFDESDKMISESDKKYKYLKDWNIDFQLEEVSKELHSTVGNSYSDLSNSEFNTSNNLISIENENLRIQYKNDENGMRQDFIVKNKPEGNGQLRLNIIADTKLKMITGADALMFKDNDGDLKLKYAALKVWDANGVELRAFFVESKLKVTNYELRDYSQNGEMAMKEESRKLKLETRNSFSIVVNDAEAVYPITIDPLSSVPSWSGEINQAGAKFGWSVATAGDVNGDGYSDVIVGAPFYDNGQLNEGGVFVYHGSINGLSLSPSWTKESDQGSANFGFSVATAGDVNGDGYSDVIIGSPLYDSGQADEGRVYIYNGSAGGLLTGYSWKYESNQAIEKFGTSVACAGDVNNDGYSDVIIGSPFYDGGQTDEGKISLFKGSSTGPNAVSADFIYESNQSNANFGLSVATAGDINGDGFSEVIAGASKWDYGFTDDGIAIFFKGNATSMTYWLFRTGTQNGEFFGHSVSTAGDVNGDGFSDVIIGAPLYDGSQTDEGKCYLYLGAAGGPGVTPVWTERGYYIGGQFGISVSTAGDMNGDGYADVILGGNYLDNGQTDEGRAFVYLGYSGGLSNYPIIIFESNQANSQFGYSVATAGDVNGDGFSDVIVGAYNYDNPSTDEGAAYVYFGSALGVGTTAAWNAVGNQVSAYFGWSVSTAGDVNGDGYSDVIIGAVNYDNGQNDEGAAFVYHGSASGLSAFANWSAEGNQVNANFGYSVSTAGDVNGDGYSDVIVGANGFDNGQTNEGAAFVYLGSASGLSSTSNWSAEGNLTGADFGNSVSTAGDVNGDGYSDVIVGAERYNNGQINEGAAFAFYGSASGLSLISNWNIERNQTSSLFGCSVSSAGDINGDGYSDVIVGAYSYDNGNNNEGAAFVYHGSASGLSLTSNWSGEINLDLAFFGFSVSTAGDVNGDGYSDIIVGAYGYGNNSGAAFVYHGSAFGLSVSSNWFKFGTQAISKFGNSVSTAGDVNGDGYSDVIIGAITFDNGQAEEGAAFIYHGSPSGLSSSSNWSAEGNQFFAYFGSSVSSAGDLNGDGYSDVIVGAPNYSDKGAAYVFYGGNSEAELYFNGGYNGGLQSTVRQFKYGSSQVVSSTGNTGENGKVRLQHFAKSPFGKGTGRIVYNIKGNGTPFNGSIISNSTSYNGTPSPYINLGLTGTNISQDMTGFDPDKQYKWRARAQYKMTSFPFQKFGPWRYYSNYVTSPAGGFRPKELSINLTLNLTMLIEGFYNAGSDLMVGDTVRVYLRNNSSPYDIVDSATAFVDPSGLGIYTFSNAVNGVNYFIHLKHRNSIETWSKTTQMFTADNLNYNFTSAITQAYGDNQKLIDNSPVKYGTYSGDENQNGIADLTDVVNVSNAANSFTNGYVSTDMNGNNITDLSDLVITSNNASAFVSKIVP